MHPKNDNPSDSDATTDLNQAGRELDYGTRASDLGFSFSINDPSQEPVTCVGRYQIVEKLGQGAFGSVYRALDETLKRHVAIKLLTKFSDASQLEGWLSEARVLASLDHPSIVPVYDVGKTDQGQPYIVSKLIEGGSLLQRRREKTWTIQDSVRIVLQLSRALEYLHSRGVIHRDIKPGNILTTAEGNAILADFGLALAETSYGKGARFVGTPAYMSPEQARLEGHRVDGRSDIYSLGVVLYELVTGSRPFLAKDREELLDCIRTIEVRPIRQLRPEVPRELERICLKMLSKKVSDRYGTAADLSEELQHWEEAATQTKKPMLPTEFDSAGEAPSARPSSRVNQQPDHPSTVRSLDLETIAVVPHGLRPFDATDADFFRFLLPGARNRDGVPDSITFWVHRILSRNEGDTFRNGVLMGPSGSGKSSLMRAGVIPLIVSDVSLIYLEAKPESLEKDLTKQICKQFGFLGEMHSLQEALTQVRQHIGSRGAKKLVLVIDQFEQWLNMHRDETVTDFHESLQQCDGVNLQSILLVRDDFMFGLSAFLDQVEELLLQNYNFATVEPFGVSHAERVLTAFGRAYGAVKDPPTSEQKEFVKKAIDELNTMGRLEPVQLTLLSEMVKDKDWTAETLANLGGIEGLEIAFLDERLGGISAHPYLRMHLPVVRRILGELLPSDNTVIKAPACPQSLLLDRLEGSATDVVLRKLLQLLDTEVRLITPTSGSNTSSASSISSSIDPAYQLTHDYLVPAIRKWLVALEIGTRAGRARIQLREMATAWNAMPSRKRLPAFAEWLAIRWFTPHKQWTKNEHRMMRAADSRLMWIANITALVFATLTGTTYFILNELHSRSLATRLIEANTGNVTQVLKEIEPYRSWVVPKLIRGQSIPRESQDSAALQSKQLHTALVLAKTDSDQATLLFEGLGTIEDQDLSAIIEYIKGHCSFKSEPLFETMISALQKRPSTGLAMASLLCNLNPEDNRWRNVMPLIGNALVRKRSTQIAYWPKLLEPLKELLAKELLSIGEQTDKRQSDSLPNTFSLIASLANDNTASIAHAIRIAPEEHTEMLLQSCAAKESLNVELRKQLAKKLRITDAVPQGVATPEKIESILGTMDSIVGSDWAMAAKIPSERLPEVLSAMRQIGFVPQTVRSYISQNSLKVAVVWKRGASEFMVASNLNSRELESRFLLLQQDGFLMTDFAIWHSPSSHSEPMWCGIWEKSVDSRPVQQVLLLDETTNSQSSLDRSKQLVGLQRIKQCDNAAHNGEPIRSSLWTASDEEAFENATWSRLAYASGDLFPGFCMVDIRCEDTIQTKDRGHSFSEFYEFESFIAQRNSNLARYVVNAATRLSACGESERALLMLKQLTLADFEKLPESERNPVQRGADRQFARIFARLGRTEELREFMQNTILPGSFTQEEKDYLSLRLAVLDKDQELAVSLLTKLDGNSKRSKLTQDYYLRALGTVASKPDFGNTAAAALSKLISLVPSWHNEEPNSIDALMEIDFDGVRNQKEWGALLERFKLSTRFTVCSNANGRVDSKAIFAESQSNHDRSAKQLAEGGFRPVCLHVNTGPNSSSFLSSVWHRPIESVQELAKSSQQTASLCLALARLGETDAVLDALNGKWGRTTSTEVILRSARLLSSSVVVAMLRQATSPELQSRLVSMAGSYKTDAFQERDLNYLTLRLSDWSDTATDGALRNVSRWCLGNWSVANESRKSTASSASKRNWIVNSLGQEMIALEPTEVFLCGRSEEKKQWVKIPRRFAIATTEVTGQHFEEFLTDPRVTAWIEKDRRRRYVRLADKDTPQSSVSWQLAMQYCQWLNEREGIAESQWCYPDQWQSGSKSATPYPNYLNRMGYRLPTQAEWEWACAAGSQEYWHFGNNESATAAYEWTTPQSNDRKQPVARLRPNALGLFDMGGNLAEWTDDGLRPPLRSKDHYFVEDLGNVGDVNSAYRALCGGRFRLTAASAVTTTFAYFAPEHQSSTTGFRIARTMPPSP